jgi:hypothetical protein
MSVVLPGFCSRKDNGQSLQVTRSPEWQRSSFRTTVGQQSGLVEGTGTDSNDGHKCP